MATLYVKIRIVFGVFLGLTVRFLLTLSVLIIRRRRYNVLNRLITRYLKQNILRIAITYEIPFYKLYTINILLNIFSIVIYYIKQILIQNILHRSLLFEFLIAII